MDIQAIWRSCSRLIGVGLGILLFLALGQSGMLYGVNPPFMCMVLLLCVNLGVSLTR